MNIIDYIDWRGDLPLNTVPLNEVDVLIFSWLAYYDYGKLMRAGVDIVGLSLNEIVDQHVKCIGQFQKVNLTTNIIPSVTATWLLYCAGMSNRFASCRIEAFEEVLDNERNIQFAALSILYDDKRIISYRGTDTSIAGWKEDCQLSYSDTVPSQLLALEFMNKRCDGVKTVLCGHSKGGNLAVYTILHVPEENLKPIEAVYNFDGPGFCTELLNMDRYLQLKGTIITIVPESSIIGMLLEHEEDYLVIESNMPSILQHDAFFWKVKGSGFVYLNDRSMTSMVVDQALQEWLKGISLSERREFVDMAFGIIENAGISDITDLTENSIGKVAKILSGMTTLSSQQRKMIVRLLLDLLKASNSALYDTLTGRGILKEAVDGLTVGSNYIAGIVDKGKNKILTTLAQGLGRKDSTRLIDTNRPDGSPKADK